MIQNIHARQILDSRSNPTVEVEMVSQRGTVRACVPSGASTGTHEVVELRDKTRAYHGKGVLCAVQSVNKIIRPALLGKVPEQIAVDNTLLFLDSTPNKSRLGANAMLGVSMAAARLAALEKNKSLYEHIASLAQARPILPVPFANILNGGKHAASGLPIQELMIAPIHARNFAQATQMIVETYDELKGLIAHKYGKQWTLVGDEGGFAPPVRDVFEALNLIEEAVHRAGYKKSIKIAIDAAASEFYNAKTKKYTVGRDMNADKLMDYYWTLLEDYPIISLEDPFAEDDFDAWRNFMERVRDKKIKKLQTSFQIVGDDLLVTNIKRIEIALEKQLCNALLLKVNQIGTVTEAIAAAKVAMHYGWNVMVSHRSGETDDSFIADLAVGLGCGQIKLGAPCRGERTAKYNQLLRIEEALGKKARYGLY